MWSVSIIIPVYQVSDYIERCVRSVMAQTYADIECIIVDDATKDDSIEKCERFIKSYDGAIWFHIFHHEQNRGLSAARNTGTKAAKGDYIYYLDSDDEITPACIEILMSAACKHRNADMVVGNYREFRQGREPIVMHDEGLPCMIQSNEDFVSYYHRHRIAFSAWNKLIRRSFIENHGLYFKEGVLYEDYLWMFHVAKHLSMVAAVNDVTYNYYRRLGSITMSANEKYVGESYKTIFEEILHHLTPGRETKELTYCVERFSKHYLNEKDSLPAYKDLYRKYLKLAWHYHSMYASMVLSIVGLMGIFGNPLFVLRPLHYMIWKVTSLALNHL